MACSRNYRLTLKIYDGDNVKVTADSSSISTTSVNELQTSIPAEAVTVQFGQNLWITVVTAELQLPLQTGKVYSYNVLFRSADNPSDKGDLRTDGLLKDDAHEERPQKALGYKSDVLPTFLLTAEDPKDLFIAHASCRKMHGHGLDALAHLDEIIKKSFELPSPAPPLGDTSFMMKRPQQLFLTGDQIYADDVPAMLLDYAGRHDAGPLVGQETVQARLNNSAPLVDVEADTYNFPPLIRGHLLQEYGGFTSGSSRNHLITFEEFAGTYLNYWSIRSWNLDFYKEVKKIIDEIKKPGGKVKTVAAEVAEKFLVDTSLPEDAGIIHRIRDEDNLRGNATQFVFNDQLNEVFNESPPAEKFDLWKKGVKNRLVGELLEMAEFVSTLPQVSRVLANTPTYMVFDDHEITDDWNLSKGWQNQVFSKPLGRDVIRNGLMAYAVFQDWGNVPDEYVAIAPSGGDTTPLTPRTKLIRKIADYGFSIGNNSGIASLRQDTVVPVENLLGMGTTPAEVKWHYNVETGPTKTFVLDTRTQRNFPSLNAPPGLITEDSIAEQIPDTLPFGNAPFSFVISAAPVFGLQSFEELIQPAAASVVAIKTTTGPNPGIVQGQIKYDFEAWGFNSEAFENLVQRLAKLEKVIVLSGDVHYAFSSVLDYWEGTSNTPKARMVQLTASSLKNEEFGFDHLYRSALAEKVLTGIGDKLEKLVWINKVLSVSGDVSIRNRHRLRQTPAVVPTAGWQTGATVSQPPDYRYRLTVQTDESDREGDPVTAEPVLTNANSVKEGYKQIVQRSQENFISGVHRRMVWPSNVGLIKFEADGASWKIRHEFLYRKGNRDITKKDVGTHIKHIMPLVASGGETTRPELS
jgi:hypothetical protein